MIVIELESLANTQETLRLRGICYRATTSTHEQDIIAKKYFDRVLHS